MPKEAGEFNAECLHLRKVVGPKFDGRYKTLITRAQLITIILIIIARISQQSEIVYLGDIKGHDIKIHRGNKFLLYKRIAQKRKFYQRMNFCFDRYLISVLVMYRALKRLKGYTKVKWGISI